MTITKHCNLKGNTVLNIITSLSPDVLVDDMLGKIKESWNQPFVSPVVIFPDSRTEQWFKLRAINTQSVLMNLKTMRLESFLFDVLKTDDNQSFLSQDLLRDIIIQKLLSNDDGQCYLTKIKDADNIGNYLNITENIDDINYQHLFDFANDLSGLFIEYEATRKDIDDAVQDEEKNWQKTLYQDIIAPRGGFDGIEFNNRYYYTCPQLAEKNKRENNGKIVFRKIEAPIFVFGFSGMGQTYRNLLKEIGKESDVCVYLQVPHEAADNVNIFLKHWAQFGNKNFELFAIDANVESKMAAYKENTVLGRVQNVISRDEEMDLVNWKNGLNLEKDDTLTITSAPSKIRELEIVHSAICDLLKNKEKNVTLKDILVLAPDIAEYKSAIATVFNQVDSDNKEYPFIPTSVVDCGATNSSVLDTLQTLYSILKNGGLNRKLFFAFAKNFLIQARYKITDDDVTNVFQQWIDSMQVYRVREANGIDDWENAVYRLLIAKLTDNDRMAPFSDISTEDNELLAKFVQIVDDIKNNWVKEFKNKKLLNKDDIEKLQVFLKGLFGLNENDELRYSKEGLIYKKIDKKLERYKEFNVSVPTECVLLSLIDVATNIRFNTGAMFSRGVTFTSLMPNRILPARYVFLLGMSSDVFPGRNNNIVLDGRIILPQQGDDDIPGKNKNAFFCQLMAACDELHISFVDKDLQTNNEFYPSCVLDVLARYTGIKTKSVGIDEGRDWDELYTPRERRNKQLCIDLYSATDVHDNKESGKNNQNDDIVNVDLPDMVKLTEFRNYLENPLKCYVNRNFGFEEEDASAAELEKIDVGPLLKDRINKRLIKPVLNMSQDDAMDNLQWDAHKDLLPNEPFGELEFENVKKDLCEYISEFREYNKEIFKGQEIDIKPNLPINIKLNCEYKDANKCEKSKKYTLYGEIFMCAYAGTDVVLYTPKKDKKDAYKRFPEMYALIAQIAQHNQQQDKEYNAHILYKNGGVERFKITGNAAEEKLNEFYRRAFIKQNMSHIPYFDSTIYDIDTKTVKVSFDKFKTQFMDTNYNNYYISHSELLNPDVNLGFTKDNFEKDFKEACDEHGQLLEVSKE